MAANAHGMAMERNTKCSDDACIYLSSFRLEIISHSIKCLFRTGIIV